MLAFGHALLAPIPWQNSMWKCCDYKSLPKDRIWAAGLFLFCLSAFCILMFMVECCLRHDKTNIPWGQCTGYIFWWHAALPWEVLWKQCWMGWLLCTSITSCSWLSCSLMLSTLLSISRSVNGRPLKSLSRLLTWKWGTLENVIRRSCSSVVML